MKTQLPRPKLLAKGRWWDEQWNPWIGCTPVGAACENCWARREEDGRFRHLARCTVGRAIRGGSYFWRGPVYQGVEKLRDPLHWRTPRVIGVCMRSDLFHEDIPDAEIDRVFAVMALCPQHTFVAPTKRTERAARWFTGGWWHNRVELAAEAMRPGIPALGGKHLFPNPLKNVWLIASVWDQDSADRILPSLFDCPAALHGVSYEPALGPLDLWHVRCRSQPFRDDLMTFDALSRKGGIAYHENVGIRWVIAGGESGPGARPADAVWFRTVRDQCKEAGVPFLFKQWGNWRWFSQLEGIDQAAAASVLSKEEREGILDGGDVCWRGGKKKAGRLLDGKTHDGWPGDAL